MPHPLPARLGSLGEAASSLRREPYTSQYVLLVVWQITIQLRTHRGGGRHRKLQSMMDPNYPCPCPHEGRKLKACSWLDPADHEDPRPRNERWKFEVSLELY